MTKAVKVEVGNGIESGASVQEQNAGKVKFEIATHTGLRHVDEVNAIRLLQEYGKEMFPKISKAEILFWNAGHNKKINDRTAEEWGEKGVILVDIGGGPFDHPVGKKGCSATQVAKYFSVSSSVEREMNDYVFANDVYGKATPFDLAQTFKFVSMALENGKPVNGFENDATIMDWALEIDRAVVKHMSKFDPRGSERLKINRFVTDIVVSAWLIQKFGLKAKNNLSAIAEKVADIGTVEFSEENCKTVKIMEMLGQNQRSILERLEKLVFNNFVNGNHTRFDISEIISCLYFYYNGDIDKTIKQVFGALDGFLWRETTYQKAGSEYKEKAREQMVTNHTGERVKVATIESDNPMMGIYTRAEENVALLVQRNPTRGSTYISVNKKRVSKNSVGDVVAFLRMKEQEIRNVPKNEQVYNWDILRSEGTLEAIPQWHFQKEASAIFNGSLSAKNVPRTAQTTEEIHSDVSAAIDHSYMPGCSNGNGCIKSECPIYKFGFARCKTKRFQNYMQDGKNDKNSISIKKKW
jgi:hypothetical protein